MGIGACAFGDLAGPRQPQRAVISRAAGNVLIRGIIYLANPLYKAVRDVTDRSHFCYAIRSPFDRRFVQCYKGAAGQDYGEIAIPI